MTGRRSSRGGGPLNMAAVSAKDEGLASLLTEGIHMEVLSWKIYKEEPPACSLISQSAELGSATGVADFGAHSARSPDRGCRPRDGIRSRG